MTSKLYDDDAYAGTFTAEVIACEPAEDAEGVWKLVLDRTLFFPEEGGQTPDRGIIKCGNLTGNVTDVQIDPAGIITHTVTMPFLIGSTVEGEIDWTHRFSNMQQHSGEHIFSGIVHSRYGYSNVGFHLSDNVVTMDYDGYLDDEQIAEIEYAVNEAIARNVPVHCSYPSAEELKSISYRSKKEIDGPLRIVEIEGYDICACCAPHVAHTGEIGIFKVVDAIRYKGGVRVSALCGFRALDYVRRLERIAKGTAVALNAPLEESAVREGLEAMFASSVEAKQRIAELSARLLDERIAKCEEDAANAIVYTEGVDNLVMRNAVNALMKQHDGYCAIFCANDPAEPDHYSYIIGSRTLDCRAASESLRSRFGAKGGGSAQMTQGSLTAQQADIAAAFATI